MKKTRSTHRTSTSKARFSLAIGLMLAAGAAPFPGKIAAAASSGAGPSSPSFGPYTLGKPMKACGQGVFMQERHPGTSILACTYVDARIDDLQLRRIDLASQQGVLKGFLLMTMGKERDRALEAALERQWGPSARTDRNGTAEWGFADGSKGLYQPTLGLVSLSAGDILGSRPPRMANPPRADLTVAGGPGQKLLSMGGNHLGTPLTRCPKTTHLERTWPGHPGVLACETSAATVGPLPADRLTLTAVDGVIVEMRVYPNREPEAGGVEALPAMTQSLKDLLGPGKEYRPGQVGHDVTWRGDDQFIYWQADAGILRVTRPGFEGAGTPLSPDPRNRQKPAAGK